MAGFNSSHKLFHEFNLLILKKEKFMGKRNISKKDFRQTKKKALKRRCSCVDRHGLKKKLYSSRAHARRRAKQNTSENGVPLYIYRCPQRIQLGDRKWVRNKGYHLTAQKQNKPRKKCE